MLAEFPAGVLLVAIVVVVPVLMYLRQLKIRRLDKKEENDAPEL